jgi:hypothetical protein
VAEEEGDGEVLPRSGGQLNINPMCPAKCRVGYCIKCLVAMLPCHDQARQPPSVEHDESSIHVARVLHSPQPWESLPHVSVLFIAESSCCMRCYASHMMSGHVECIPCCWEAKGQARWPVVLLNIPVVLSGTNSTTTASNAPHTTAPLTAVGLLYYA